MASAQKAQQKSSPFCGRKVELTIHKDSNKYAIDPVPVAVEGIQFTIRRGEKVVVPIEVVEALEHAVTTQYDQIMDDDKSVRLVPRDSLSYPFSVLREVTQ